jgi:uncharacterized protein YxjI
MRPLPTQAAIFPNYIGPKLVKLRLTRSSGSDEWTITTMTGLVMLTVDTNSTVLNSNGDRLFQICKEPSSNTYYGQKEENGPKSWVFERESVFSSRTFSFSFNNTETGRRNMLEAKRFSFGTATFVNYCGQQVAVIDKLDYQKNDTYELSIAAGLDMTLVVAIALAMDYFKMVQSSKGSGRRRRHGRHAAMNASMGASAAAAASSAAASAGSFGGGGFGGGGGGC